MKKSKIFLIGALLLASTMFTGCLSLTGAIMEGASETKFRKEIANSEEKLTPENSVIFFGTGAYSVGLIQQNPKYGKSLTYSYGKTDSGLLTVTSFFLFQPLPLNRDYKVYSYTYPVSDGTMTVNCGLGGVDFTTAKAGLLYYDDSDPNHKNEKAALKVIKEYYEGTDWEPLIEARLKELK